LAKNLVCCGILEQEIRHLLKDRQTNIKFIDPGQHVDLASLAGALAKTAGEIDGSDTAFVIGQHCHPDMADLISGKGNIVQAKNCIEMLIGDDLAKYDGEARTFYITAGWLENWRKIFIDGLKWDAVDARQNFGFYDRILLLDTGLAPIDEEKVLEFFEYTEVPIEIVSINLDHFRKILEDTIGR